MAAGEIIIYHNGECSKCRGALEMLIAWHISYRVRWYMTDPLTRTELYALLGKLNMKASELIRISEDLYLQKYRNRTFTEEQWLDILLDNPVLLQRPIVENADKAIVARPPERALELL